MPNEREYKISVGPKILDLLGPNLYTNIYYVLSELIANAYDADAANVYIIEENTQIIVEDDGSGMSYSTGDISHYLQVAEVSRTDSSNSRTAKGRLKMGRKGIGKLAALSVSEEVYVRTLRNTERSGFILKRDISDDNILPAIPEEQITFRHVSQHGTSITMTNPRYALNKGIDVVERNLLRLFPLVNEGFRIHVTLKNGNTRIIDCGDKSIIGELAVLTTLGSEFEYLKEYFQRRHTDDNPTALPQIQGAHAIPLKMKNRDGVEKEYTLEIKGWIGAYQTTTNRKRILSDFPDNFISLFANKKLGEFNILPKVGQNVLHEVYVVGQLHVDLFEESELPDMALSNRQGYKSDDPRYIEVLKYVKSHLLPKVVEQRSSFGKRARSEKKKRQHLEQKSWEECFKKSVERFTSETTQNVALKIRQVLPQANVDMPDLESIIEAEINSKISALGIKKRIDTQKKKILISHTNCDKKVADIIYKMLTFNGIPPDDILYTSCDEEVACIPAGINVYDYLRDFFVNSFSTQKIYVIFLTSKAMSTSWGALLEVGAAWITRADHQLLSISGFTPKAPLDIGPEWHNFEINHDSIIMTMHSQNGFISNIERVCAYFNFNPKAKAENIAELKKYVQISG